MCIVCMAIAPSTVHINASHFCYLYQVVLTGYVHVLKASAVVKVSIWSYTGHCHNGGW